MVSALEFEVGDYVSIPSRLIPYNWVACWGTIIRKKFNPLPIYTVEIKMHNGIKIRLDVPEEELKFF